MTLGDTEQALLGRIGARLGPRGLVLAAQDKQAYERSARHGGGRARAVVRPADEEELAWVVRALAEANMPMVVQGAATGLVGAGTPTSTGLQWVVSTQRLRDVLQIDPVNRSATVAAGYRLSDLNKAAQGHGLTFPIDLGSDPTLGGMVATNTGGARLIRYGGVRENLLDVQAVQVHPAGQRVGFSHGLRKNNTGLAWSQLLCGTFGAFGIVSRATVKLHPVQRQSATALIAVDAVETAISLVTDFEQAMGEFVSAFEGMSRGALEAVARHGPGGTMPFASAPEYAVLLEVSSAIPVGQGLDLEALLMAWLERCLEGGGIVDAVVDKPDQLWRLRHAVSESVQSLGRMVAFDLAVSRSRFAAFRAHALTLIEALIPHAQVCDFGHLGDGGIHLNLVVPAETSQEQIGALRTAVYRSVVEEFGGSFSAEHGVGPYNAEYFERFTEVPLRELAGALQRHCNPDRLLGNVRLD